MLRHQEGGIDMITERPEANSEVLESSRVQSGCNPNRETVDAVKQAHKEIEQEKVHAQVHGRINAKLAREVPVGKAGACKCGICGQIIEYRNRELIAGSNPIGEER